MPRREHRGFDPQRPRDVQRPPNLVPRILAQDDPLPGPASGFTEIHVLGIGGAGNNAINRMVEAGVSGVEFIAVNTDGQALESSGAARRLVIGPRATRNLGAGGDPHLGERAARESSDELAETVDGADMVFIAAGMGGGTGTGAAPTVAEMARNAGALTVGVVTLPFAFEGRRRAEIAREGVRQLAECVDSLIVVHNEKLLEQADARLNFTDAFSLADEMLLHGVQSVTDLITTTGLVNVDFADVRTVMERAGAAMMGLGQASGNERARRALEQAMRSPLLETSINDAQGVLLNITSSEDVTLAEVNHAAQQIAEAVSQNANIIFGSVIDARLRDTVRVTLIATGTRADSQARRPTQRRRGRQAGRTARLSTPLLDELGGEDDRSDDSQPPAFIRRRRGS